MSKRGRKAGETAAEKKTAKVDEGETAAVGNVEAFVQRLAHASGPELLVYVRKVRRKKRGKKKKKKERKEKKREETQLTGRSAGTQRSGFVQLWRGECTEPVAEAAAHL